MGKLIVNKHLNYFLLIFILIYLFLLFNYYYYLFLFCYHCLAHIFILYYIACVLIKEGGGATE